MKFTIKSTDLKSALASVQGATEKKTTIPVLANVLIESLGEARIRITATDLDVTIVREVEADIAEQGTFCVLGRKLFELSRAITDGDVTFAVDSKDWVTVTHGRAKYRIAGIESNQFPQVAHKIPPTCFIEGDVLSEMVAKTAFAVTAESFGTTIKGVKLTVGNGQARMVSTDSYRLSIIDKQVDGNLDVLIPQKALPELARLTGEIGIAATDNEIFFSTDDTTLICRKYVASFPNYQLIIPTDANAFVLVDVAEMLECLRRVILMADDRIRSVRLTLTDGTIQMVAQSTEQGEGSEILDAEYTGDELMFGYRWQYLLEPLLLMPKDGKVRLAFNREKAKNSPQILTLDGDNSWQCILVPLNLG